MATINNNNIFTIKGLYPLIGKSTTISDCKTNSYSLIDYIY